MIYCLVEEFIELNSFNFLVIWNSVIIDKIRIFIKNFYFIGYINRIFLI